MFGVFLPLAGLPPAQQVDIGRWFDEVNPPFIQVGSSRAARVGLLAGGHPLDIKSAMVRDGAASCRVVGNSLLLEGIDGCDVGLVVCLVGKPTLSVKFRINRSGIQ